MMTWFIPLQIIWFIAFLTYYQDPEGNGGRDGITITAFLGMIFYQTEIKASLPRVEYVTWIEVYLFTYTLLVGVSCIEFVVCIVYYRDNGPYDKILDILNGPKDKRKQSLHEAVNDMDEEQLNELIKSDTEDDVSEKYFAVSLDQKMRLWVPTFTLLFNVVSIMWLVFDTTSPRMPAGDKQSTKG